MKLYICENPYAVVLARDESHARVLLKQRFRERGIRASTDCLTEVSRTRARVLIPPQKRSQR